MTGEIGWIQLWQAHSNLFVTSNWQEYIPKKQQKWPLPAEFTYFSGGDMKLRAGIVVKGRLDKEEEFLKAGLLWAAQLGNGARTIIYFVAPQFSNRFLRAVEELGGVVTGKAFYWRERLEPSLFPAAADGAAPGQIAIDCPNWARWEQQLNPVEASHLRVLRRYFEDLEKVGARTTFRRNRIALCLGPLELVQIKRTGSKLEFATTAKWAGRSAAERYQKAGWVDVEGRLNADFQNAVNEMLALIQNLRANKGFDTKDSFSLLLWDNQPEIVTRWGECWDLPCLSVDGKAYETNKIFFMREGTSGASEETETRPIVHVIYPILDKAFLRMPIAIWWYTLMQEIAKSLPDCRWDGQITCWIAKTCQEEFRIAIEAVKNRRNFPCYLIDKNWKQTGILDLKELN